MMAKRDAEYCDMHIKSLELALDEALPEALAKTFHHRLTDLYKIREAHKEA